MEYHGEERRQDDRDHDILIRIDQNMKNLSANFKDHKKENDEHHQTFFNRIGNNQKAIWLIFGGILVIEALLQIFR